MILNKKFKGIVFVFLTAVLLSGCAIIPKPAILTSSEQQWIIKKGDPFTAITASSNGKSVKLIAEDDLSVTYKGKLLELEKAADARAFTAADSAKTKGLLIGGGVSLLLLAAGLAIKGLFANIFKPK